MLMCDGAPTKYFWPRAPQSHNPALFMGAKFPGRIEPKFFLEEDIRDVITCFKFGDDRFRGLASAEGQILPFHIDFDGRPYNTLTL